MNDDIFKQKDEITISNSSTRFDDYIEKCSNSKKVAAKFDNSDILILPTKYENDEYYFAQESIDFIKFCRQYNDSNSIDILSDNDIKMRSLHSFDLWMPVIWVASNVVLPIVVGLVTNYIYDKLKGRENEDAQIDITFMVNRDGEEDKIIHYKGDAKTFEKTFNKIDINKM
ncbi:MAG: hypothetical protein IJL63_06765 [Clostridia bacterium]|nr:hypothetical protein [Clostridia bacterium]